MYLFLDYETTGFPKKMGPAKQDKQARACQLAMLLTDEHGKSMAEFSCMIQLPEGIVIDPGAAAAHGFTTELCDQYGVGPGTAYGFFCAMASRAQMVIAFNSEFDKKMAEIEAAYAEKPFPKTPWHCAMIEATPVCNLPPTDKMKAAGFIKNKPPKLEEALNIICGESLGDTAHDALWDCRALKKIFFKMREQKREIAANG